MKRIAILGLCSLVSIVAYAQDKIDQSPEFYRSLVMRLRTETTFKIPSPIHDAEITYSFHWAQPAPGYELPRTAKMDFDLETPLSFYSYFWDRIFVTDGSTIKINDEILPVTCVFVQGQDNRRSGINNPLLPNIVMKVYIVANDFGCEGPINQGFPSNGGREETWDTYMFYMVKDPTIMLPVESKLRYRWNEYETVLMDRP